MCHVCDRRCVDVSYWSCVMTRCFRSFASLPIYGLPLFLSPYFSVDPHDCLLKAPVESACFVFVDLTCVRCLSDILSCLLSHAVSRALSHTIAFSLSHTISPALMPFLSRALSFSLASLESLESLFSLSEARPMNMSHDTCRS